jgi:hypothetical protein
MSLFVALWFCSPIETPERRLHRVHLCHQPRAADFQGMMVAVRNGETAEERVQMIQNFKVKDGDIFLSTYPK